MPDSYDVLAQASSVYRSDQEAACATARLTRELGAEATLAWDNYLIDYTHALAGCEIPPASYGGRGFLPGGIGQFGPANLSAIGVAQPELGQDDADRLIAQYVDAFAEALHLTELESAAVRAFLSRAAQAQVRQGLSSALSSCADMTSAGG